MLRSNFSRTAAMITWALISSATNSLAQDYSATLQQQMQYNQQLMQQNEMRMQQAMQETDRKRRAALQTYIAQNRSTLERETERYNSSTGQNLSVEQYAENSIREQAAANLNRQQAGNGNPMFQQQQEMFRRGQEAYQQRQQGFAAQNQMWQQQQNQIDSGNQAWMDQQRQKDVQQDIYVQQGIYGNQNYRNQETGEVAELPFANEPGLYQDNNGNSWVGSDRMGEYQQVTPDGRFQEMEAIPNEEYYDE